jgi:hypothetical protein
MSVMRQRCRALSGGKRPLTVDHQSLIINHRLIIKRGRLGPRIIPIHVWGQVGQIWLILVPEVGGRPDKMASLADAGRIQVRTRGSPVYRGKVPVRTRLSGIFFGRCRFPWTLRFKSYCLLIHYIRHVPIVEPLNEKWRIFLFLLALQVITGRTS